MGVAHNYSAVCLLEDDRDNVQRQIGEESQGQMQVSFTHRNHSSTKLLPDRIKLCSSVIVCLQ